MIGNNIDANKRKYMKFCDEVYIPIYSKPWWLDAICLPENWDVWLCEDNGKILAAMPYYSENRIGRKYITKAPLSQNNGIIFNHPENAKFVARAAFEEKVIDKACEFIKSLGLDVYEQQYQPSFTNWLPFFWNYYTATTRYTYVIEDTTNMEVIWSGITSKRRSVIKKGLKNSVLSTEMSIEDFYREHEKIYIKQGLSCPFSFDLWERVATACLNNNAGRISCRLAADGNVAAVSFVAWDDRALYKLMGGPMPDYAKLDAYSALTWDEIELAHDLGLMYDFEGSVIKRISKSFREYGAEPKPYFRIRKVFNPEIMREEAEMNIQKLTSKGRTSNAI